MEEGMPEWMAQVQHHTVTTNGIRMHYAEQGSGPAVLLLHGFPEFWYSWRYQMPALAAAGFRAIAPDLRGCGQTDAPAGMEHYSAMHITGDIVGLLDALGEDKPVFVVAHDWGAVAAWDLCLFRPDRVKAVVCLSVPYLPRLPGTSSSFQIAKKILGEGFYQCRFEEPGRAERDFARTGTKQSLQKMLYSGVRELWIAPEEQELMESLPMPARPPWISEFDIQYYAEDKERSGWTGGLNWYRASDLSFELKAAWTGVGVSTRALFVAGGDDLVMKFPTMRAYLEGGKFKEDVPNLEDVVVLEGVGHFLQQEQADKVNNLLIAFFNT